MVDEPQGQEPLVPADPPASPTQPKADDREPSYVLLVLSESTGEWLVTNDSVTARSAEAAVRLHAENTTVGDPSGTYVAVPVRSWKPLKVTPTTVTTLTVEEAK